MASRKFQQMSVLTMSTLAFTVCFMTWVIFSVIGIPIKTMLQLNETQFGLLAATPILTGALIRLPLGMWTDRHGGRIVFFLLMLSTIIPIYLISYATEYWQFLVLGLFAGVAGGAFSVGISYVSHWFSARHKGAAMGVFGAGNTGAAVTKFLAPALVVAYGWEVVPKVYAAIMTVMAILFWFLTYSDPSHKVASTTTIKQQLAVLKDPKVWKYCQFYSVVFGGYVGVSLWMTKYYVSEYGHDLKTAALLAAIFVFPSGVIRALGGWFSDRFGAHNVTWWVLWVSLVCLFFMSYPEINLLIKTVNGQKSMHIALSEATFTALLFIVGIAWGIGKASVFKYISDQYATKNVMGVVSGIVGLAGGLAGFLLPIIFGALVDLTGVRTTAWMQLFGATAISLIWFYWPHTREDILAPDGHRNKTEATHVHAGRHESIAS